MGPRHEAAAPAAIEGMARARARAARYIVVTHIHKFAVCSAAMLAAACPVKVAPSRAAVRVQRIRAAPVARLAKVRKLSALAQSAQRVGRRQAAGRSMPLRAGRVQRERLGLSQTGAASLSPLPLAAHVAAAAETHLVRILRQFEAKPAALALSAAGAALVAEAMSAPAVQASTRAAPRARRADARMPRVVRAGGGRVCAAG